MIFVRAKPGRSVSRQMSNLGPFWLMSTLPERELR